MATVKRRSRQSDKLDNFIDQQSWQICSHVEPTWSMNMIRNWLNTQETPFRGCEITTIARRIFARIQEAASEGKSEHTDDTDVSLPAAGGSRVEHAHHLNPDIPDAGEHADDPEVEGTSVRTSKLWLDATLDSILWVSPKFPVVMFEWQVEHKIPYAVNYVIQGTKDAVVKLSALYANANGPGHLEIPPTYPGFDRGLFTFDHVSRASYDKIAASYYDSESHRGLVWMDRSRIG